MKWAKVKVRRSPTPWQRSCRTFPLMIIMMVRLFQEKPTAARKEVRSNIFALTVYSLAVLFQIKVKCFILLKNVTAFFSIQKYIQRTKYTKLWQNVTAALMTTSFLKQSGTGATSQGTLYFYHFFFLSANTTVTAYLILLTLSSSDRYN